MITITNVVFLSLKRLVRFEQRKFIRVHLPFFGVSSLSCSLWGFPWFYRPQRSLGQGNFLQASVCMMSLPVWLPGPMFLPGGLCAWSHVPSRGCLSSGFLSRGSRSSWSRSRGFSVQGVSICKVKSGRYISYWNGFLFLNFGSFNITKDLLNNFFNMILWLTHIWCKKIPNWNILRSFLKILLELAGVVLCEKNLLDLVAPYCDSLFVVLEGCSHDAIATAIYLLQPMGYMWFSVAESPTIWTLRPRSHHKWRWKRIR